MFWRGLATLLAAATIVTVNAQRDVSGVTCPSGSPDISVANPYDLVGTWSRFFEKSAFTPDNPLVPNSDPSPGVYVHFDRLEPQVLFPTARVSSLRLW
jgi:hypothetical protein